jgi:MOSC domain-containing protein YiiM
MSQGSMSATGRLIGIAVRDAYRAPMQRRDSALLSVGAGVEGDYKGAKHPRRGVTVLSREAWEAALADLGAQADALDWTARRANLLVEGVRLPRAVGAVLCVGDAVIEVTYPTTPCSRMDEARPGLMRALYPDWRGGITARIIEGGRVAVGDRIEVISSPPERTKIKLPG